MLLAMQTAAAIDLSESLRRLGETNCHCSVSCCPLSRRKTTHKTTCNHCRLSYLKPHSGRCCVGD